MPSEIISPFPQEIIDLIIESIWSTSFLQLPISERHRIWSTDFLPISDRDRHVLKACALVSRSFRESAQAALFAFITINFRDLDPATDRRPARDPSAFTPRLRNFVATLRLRYFPANLDQNYYLTMHFPKLAGLYFEGYYGLEWPSIPPWLRKGFYSMMQLPTVTVLRMNGIGGFPAVALQPCSQLRELVIVACTFSADTGADKEYGLTFSVSENSDKQCYLRVLKYYVAGLDSTLNPLIDALSCPSSLLSVMRLQRLMVSTIDDDSYADCQRILELTSPYLEDLGVWFGHFDSFRVLRFPRPEILHGVSIDCSPGQAIDVVGHLSRLAASHPNLTWLNIRMFSNMRLTSVRDFDPHAMAGFKLLDDKLMSEPFATNLKLTRLVLYTYFEEKVDEEILTILELIMPRFLSTRRIEVVDPSGPTTKFFFDFLSEFHSTLVNLYL